MPNTKISAEAALTGAALDRAVDVLPIVDISAGTTGNRKITPDEIMIGAPATVSLAGSMSAADKTKLDSITVGNLLTTNTAQTITGLKTIPTISIAISSSKPSAPASNNVLLYASDIGGRSFPVTQTPDGREYLSQTGLARNPVTIFYPTNGSTIGTYGQFSTTLGTVSHIAPTDDLVPLMVNLASASVTNVNVTPNTTFIASSLSTNSRLWCRGTNANGFGGYFYFTRILFPDSTYTNTRFYAGLYTWLPTSISKGWYDGYITSTDTPDGNFSGFSYSTFRSDSTFQFITKDGTTQTTTPITGATFTNNKLYDFYIYCPRAGSTISYKIDNLTDGTSYTGSTSATLPTANEYMSAGIQIRGESVNGRNLRFNRVYVE
ncbi:hypothetical protein [Calothrix sp. PCC 7507]|uniref:hypothetical protein n=1 Tax=Calothrix sp. PCC 7507 TaxID=99598 RepID=UPI00029ED8B5|nr:hypothetical protein [Calothrix sp. PCC 7507]AFY31811.1 hypothetical protein Cal7507_1341 [Calothrix sp. PCC 7507]